MRILIKFPLLLLLLSSIGASGFGSMGPIAASFGENSFFCAIDASGKQDVICWAKNSSSISSSSSVMNSASVSNIPPMAALSGGEGFICGILANNSQAFCWSSNSSGTDLVPSVYKSTSYSHIAAGKNHVCALRGSYNSDHDPGIVDCWEIVRKSDNTLSSIQSTLYYDEYVGTLVLEHIVSGEGFTCGAVKEHGVVCWGPNSWRLGVYNETQSFKVLSSDKNCLCGISSLSNQVKCWGCNDSSLAHPIQTQFVSLAGGAHHFCGIREDSHGVECWGRFNISSIPRNSGFMAIASSDFTTCGIRENDLVLDCWFANNSLTSDFEPPLELCSPGICTPGSCSDSEFAYNASFLNEPDLNSLCIKKDLKICSPCGSNCSEGFFLSSPCTSNSDRVCTACSLCQNSTCWDICKIQASPEKHWRQLRKLILIIGGSALGFLLIIVIVCFLPRSFRKKEGTKKQFKSCIGKPDLDIDAAADSLPPPAATCPGAAQVFRLSELKDATNGFKEFNELGRGSYGFVYKAVLPDGRLVAVKRANAATIIHTNIRDFEMELEVLCNIRHTNIVNLIGYCLEMGERLLVYEFMPHGTLFDHLHSGLSPLNWSLRLRISMQAAKGLEYLHKGATPPIVHHDIKTSNILLDSDWSARIADFGLLTSNEKDASGDAKADVYNFGIVLLEILSGRKTYDSENTPPDIVEWALPLIKQGKAAAIIDRNVALPRNVEPLLKLADIAEQAVRENISERPSMSEVATWLEQIVKDGLVL